MRIISKFKDYYDKGMAQGFDSSLMYVRETQTFQDVLHSLGSVPKEFQPLLTKYFNYNRIPRFESSASAYTNYGIILFAGKLHPYAKFHVNALHQALEHDIQTEALKSLNYSKFNKHANTYAYTLEEFVTLFEKLIPEKSSKNLYAYYDSSFKRQSKIAAEFFSKKEPPGLLEYCQDNSLVCAQYEHGYPFEFTINPLLSDFQFFKKLDPYQAFQEINMFLSNIAKVDDTPIKIDDKYRIAQYGFDKWSFRKPPQK